MADVVKMYFAVTSVLLVSLLTEAHPLLHLQESDAVQSEASVDPLKLQTVDSLDFNNQQPTRPVSSPHVKPETSSGSFVIDQQLLASGKQSNEGKHVVDVPTADCPDGEHRDWMGICRPLW